MNCYQIAQNYQALADLIDIDPETGEILDADTYNELLKEIDDSRDEKLINIEYIKREVQAENELISSEIKRLQARKKANETKEERLSNLQLMLMGEDKIKTPFYSFSTRKSESVQVPDECNPIRNSYPKEWVKTTYTFDKTAIKETLKSGIDYSDKGVSIVTKVSLSVR